MKTKQKGFTVVEGLLLIIALAIMSIVGYYVWNTNHKDKAASIPVSSSSNTPRSSTTPAATKLNEIYTNAVGSFSINYPSSWTLGEDTVGEDTSKNTLTSPTGTVLNLKADYGGYGGDCRPEDTDKPFASGNACVSWEYLSNEKLPVSTVYKKNDTGKLVKAEVYMQTWKYGDPDGKITYLVGVTSGPATLNKSEMGLNYPFNSLTVYDSAGTFRPYIYIFTRNESQSSLTSADATTIKEIIRTLKIDL